MLVLVLVGAGGYFVGLPMFEKQAAEKVAAFIETLPGDIKADDIKVSFLGKEVRITSLRGTTTYIDGSDMYVDVASIVCSGVNLDAGKAPGVTDIVDAMHVTGMKLQTKTNIEGLERQLEQEALLTDLKVTGLRGDLFALSAASSSTETDQAARLKVMMDALLTIHVDAMEGREYINRTSSDLRPMTASLDTFSYKDFSPLSYGPMDANNFKLNAFNSDLLTIERISSKAGHIPNIFNLAFNAEADPEASLKEFIDIFSKEALVLDEIVMEKLSFKLMMEEPLTLAKGVINLRMSADKVVLQHNLEGLFIPVELYRKASMEADQFARQYGKGLDISASVDLEVHQKDGSGDIFVKSLRMVDKNLGSASITADLLFQGRGDSLEDLLNDGADLLLKKSRTELDDTGFMEVFYGMQYASMERFNMLGDSLKSPADLRALMSRSTLEEAAAVADPDQKRVLEGLAQLLAAPGKLVVSLNPDQPVDMDTLSEGGSDGTPLNSSVEYVPAQ